MGGTPLKNLDPVTTFILGLLLLCLGWYTFKEFRPSNELFSFWGLRRKRSKSRKESCPGRKESCPDGAGDNLRRRVVIEE